MNTSPNGPAPVRIANVSLVHDQADERIAVLAQQAELDLLQLDYDWPTILAPNSFERTNDRPTFAGGFLRQLEALHTVLFLNPGFVLVTNAGASDPIGCVEAVSRFLCNRGENNTPVSAIRGSDLLGRIEELSAAGVELANVETDVPFRELRRPIHCARVQVGAGPLVTSLTEGARIVVAGCYNRPAPTLAMGVHHFGWAWSDYDCLAGAAVASRLTRVAEYLSSSESPDMERSSSVVSIGHDGSSQLQPLSPNLAARGNLLAHQSLVRDLLTSDCYHPFDVNCDLTQLHIESNSRAGLRIDGAIGQPADSVWPVVLWYESHYVASAIVEISGRDVEKQLASALAAVGSLQDESKDQSCTVKFERLILESGSDCITPERTDEKIRLHLSWQNQNRQACEQFTQMLSFWAGRQNPRQIHLLEPWPTVRLQLAAWPTHVPTEMVDIAVDTRAAKEWE